MRLQVLAVVAALSLGLSAGGPTAYAADAAPAPEAAAKAPDAAKKDAKATTTSDPNIDLGDLQLLLDPLNKDEVGVEATEWAKLLRAKVREISDAELAVRRKNREIAALKEVKSAAEKVADASIGAGREPVKASVATPGEQQTSKLAEANAQLAQTVEATKKQEAKAAVDGKTADGKSVEAPAQPSDKAVLERAIQSAEAKADKSGDQKDVGAKVVAKAKEEAAADQVARLAKETPAAAAPAAAAEKAEQIATKADEAAAAKKDVKVQLVDYSTKLGAEKTAIIDRLKVVLAQQDKLGGDSKDARAYIDAVSGLKVEVSDYVATIARLKAWATADEGGLRWARNVAQFLAAIIGSIIMAKIVRVILARSMAISSNTSQLLRQFVVTWSGYVVMAAGLLLGLASLEVNLAPLLAMIGAAGFVVAFALQGTLSNLASGLLILVNKPFDIGDNVEAGGIEGRVESVSVFSTYIITEDGSRKIVPNNSIWGSVIVNRTTGAVTDTGAGAAKPAA